MKKNKANAYYCNTHLHSQNYLSTNFISQKGITLVALIITIIVMLILVGVTVNVAMSGGLIDKAIEARDKQELAIIREQLQELVLANANTNFEVEEGFLGTITIKGEEYNVFAIDENGIAKVELLKNGETQSTYTYELGNDLKISGISISSYEEDENTPILQINVGDVIKYNNENWVVFYNDSTNGLQIIPATTKAPVTLYGLDGLENCITYLIEACNGYVYREQGAVAARCVGKYAFGDNTYQTKQTLKTRNEQTEIIIPNNTENDADIQAYGAALVSNNLNLTSDFWVASPIAYCELSAGVIDAEVTGGTRFGLNYFDISEINNNPILEEYLVTYNYQNHEITQNSIAKSLVPVIKLRYGKITINGGTGTSANPYTYTYNPNS